MVQVLLMRLHRLAQLVKHFSLMVLAHLHGVRQAYQQVNPLQWLWSLASSLKTKALIGVLNG
jgi:hypothetical protein